MNNVSRRSSGCALRKAISLRTFVSSAISVFDQSIQLVLTRRADATINDSLSFLDFKKHKPDAPVKIAAQEDNADYSGVIIRKQEPELLAAINKALDDMKTDGTYAKISDKYFGQDVSK